MFFSKMMIDFCLISGDFSCRFKKPYPNEREGAHCAPPPPPLPQVHFFKHLKNVLSYGFETFWQYQWTNFSKQMYIFNRLCAPLLTIATSNVDACFWNTHFGSFHARAQQNSTFFCFSTTSVPNVACGGSLGLIFCSMAFKWQFSFCTLFRGSTTLN